MVGWECPTNPREASGLDPETVHLSWKANEDDVDTRFINVADTVNREMPEHVVGRVVEQLNDHGTALSNADVLVVGAAYKPDVSDTRESPAIDIVTKLADWNASVEYHDPHVPELDVGDATYESVSLTDDRLRDADCVVVVTDHSVFDVDRIVDEAPLVFDARNATSHRDDDHVVRL
ncbi:UDP binding domain-containing protein [Halobacterium salinarum]|uniref:UDP binding domain-containing protein n=1 Tax=Halobacterium salinarum TaxID=2242 RepID=UPI002555F88D|nr:UDP binding domain-containing protein [Halobacterium salinarum]MDL0132516.1 UDP binding domain-containing protein [Halobacterium salinarum]